MKKIINLVAVLFFSSLAFAEVKIAIHEPVRFKNVNTKAYGDVIVGEGALEVLSTKLEDDYGKKIKFRFAEKGVLTNGKRWIEIDKFKMGKDDEEFTITKEKKIVKFYAFLKRRNLNKNELDGSLVEGEYTGQIPIIAELYGKPINSVAEGEDRPNLLPSFPHNDEDRPTILPSFPDDELNRPTTLPNY